MNINEFTQHIEQQIINYDANKHLNNSFNITNLNTITLHNYIKRLVKYFNYCSFEITLIYIERLIKKGFILHNYNVLYVLGITFMIIEKMFCDYVKTSAIYAYLIGTKLEFLNKMEIEYLKIIDYNLYVNL